MDSGVQLITRRINVTGLQYLILPLRLGLRQVTKQQQMQLVKEPSSQKRNCSERKQKIKKESDEQVLDALDDEAWIMDSGATDHLTHRRGLFSIFEDLSTPLKIQIGGKSSTDAVCKGSIQLVANIDGKWLLVTQKMISMYMKQGEIYIQNYRHSIRDCFISLQGMEWLKQRLCQFESDECQKIWYLTFLGRFKSTQAFLFLFLDPHIMPQLSTT